MANTGTVNVSRDWNRRSLASIQTLNDSDRENPNLQVWHTLLGADQKVIRSQAISRKAARARNEFNAENAIPLQWVIGKGEA